MKGFRGPLKKILVVLRSFSLLGVWSGGLGVCAVRPGGILFKPDVQLSADSARAVSFFVHAPVCFGFPFPPANRLCLGRRHRVRNHGLHPPLEPVSARLAPVPADAIHRRFPLLTPPDETEQQPRPTPCGAAVRFLHHLPRTAPAGNQLSPSSRPCPTARPSHLQIV